MRTVLLHEQHSRGKAPSAVTTEISWVLALDQCVMRSLRQNNTKDDQGKAKMMPFRQGICSQLPEIQIEPSQGIQGSVGPIKLVSLIH